MATRPGEHPFPVIDNHCHLDRRGEYLEAVEAFWRAGGTHLNVVHKPDFRALPTDRGGYLTELAATCDMVDEIERETPVRAFATLAPHPVDLVKHVDNGMDVAAAEDLVRQGIEAAAQLVGEGRAVALGEVGRPHFEVPGEVMEASNRLFEHAMVLARDVGCAIVVHTESTTPEVCRDIAQRAERAGKTTGKTGRKNIPVFLLFSGGCRAKRDNEPPKKKKGINKKK